METIKVNMTPCDDVQTIHASQNDGEARQWGFELHNNGDAIGSSEITDQLVFKAYEGGTEQILPENGSTPTTSPFLGDIKYPQGLLTDQEFTYRQSPTESDGLAFVESIKGNTLNWNQQLNDTGSTTTTNGITFTKNADGSITLNGTATAQADYTFARFDYINGHKYLINGIPSGATVNGYRAFLFSTNETSNRIITTTRDDWFTPRIRVSSGVTVSNVVFRLNIFDLTKMGLDSITSVGEFTSLFPSYYAYNQGSLLPFRGEGLKTTGKNQFGEIQVGMRPDPNTGVITPSSNTNWVGKKIFTNGKINVLALSSNGYIGSVNIAEYETNGNYIQNTTFFYGSQIRGNFRASKTLNANTAYVIPNGYQSGGASAITGAEIELSTYDIETFEPYTSSTISLPISIYFPTGMKSAGTVYDELALIKAITRISSFVVNGNSVNYHDTASTGIPYVRGSIPQDAITNSNNIKTVDYLPIATAPTNSGYIRFLTGNFYLYDSAFTDLATAKSILNANPVTVYYESATPTETSFTTASLVTENAEIPLSNEDGVLIGKCTEQLSAEPGFHDVKIKLSDADGECYSNKLQLHVERKP